jgi:hypothetical protein
MMVAMEIPNENEISQKQVETPKKKKKNPVGLFFLSIKKELNDG